MTTLQPPPDAEIEAQLAARSVAVPRPPRPPRQRARTAPAPVPAPDPDIPFPPISLADLAQLAVDQGVDPATMPAATRAAYEAAQGVAPADDLAGTLRRLLAKAETAEEFGAALKALELLERRGSGDDHRKAPELTRAELMRIAAGEPCAECARRAG